MKKFLVVVAGPTASGKTSLAIELALHFKTEIISCDSRQFFKELTIGTAKPTGEQLKKVKHHFINSLFASEEYHAGQFEEDALKLLDKLFKAKDVVIMTGGSGLYIEAVCSGFDHLPERDETLRSELKEILSSQGIGALQEKLKTLDEEYFARVDINNPQRLMRAVEVCILTGKKYSQLRQHKTAERNFSVIKIGVDVERGLLYERINKRADEMITHGLLDEAKSVYKFRKANALQTVGYKELFDYIDGKISLEEAVELIKRNTRRYAKRQLTWFKKDKEFIWFKPGDMTKIISHIQQKLNK